MQDVTIKAPKAALSVPQVLSWVGIVTAIKDLLVSQKVEIPGAISDALTTLNNLATSLSSATPPTNLDGILSDLLVILKSVEVTTGQNVISTGIGDVIAALTWTQTGLANVESGQFATLATASRVLSTGGEPIPVALLACRMDQGAAAQAAGFQEPPVGALTVAATDYDALQSKCDTLTADLAQANAQIVSLNAALKAAAPAVPEPPQQAPETPPAQ